MPTNENRLIELLGRTERKRLTERCEPCDMALSAVICERNARTRHVYFPITGFVSLVIDIGSRPGPEVGMVGHEGMLGAELLLGHTAAPWRAVVQGAGSSWRMKVPAFQQALVDSPALRHIVGR